MKAEGWRDMIMMFATDALDGKPENLDRLAKQLEEEDAAKQCLRDKGYGWTGLSLLKTVQLVPDERIADDGQ